MSDVIEPCAVGRWFSLGTMQRRIVEGLIEEISRTSGDVESETSRLTRLFQSLALKADAQNRRVADLSSVANHLSVNGESVTIDALASMFDESLTGIVSKILLLSQNAMAMVYAFDEVNTSMTAVQECIKAVDRINGQTRMLAINARIEAARSGEAGRAFTVIADEVRGLSSTTQQLADTMRTHVQNVVRGLTQSHEALRAVATIDMSENIMAKEKLDMMVGALLERGGMLSGIVEDATADAGAIAVEVNSAITSLQFQDRVSQRLDQVMDTLRVVCDAVTRLQEDLPLSPDGQERDLAEQTAWLHELASRYRLSEMRAAFVSRVIEGQQAPAAETEAPAEAGSIDLF